MLLASFIKPLSLRPPLSFDDWSAEKNSICDVVSNIDDPATDGFTCDEVFFNTWINTKAAHGWHWVVVNLGEYEDKDNDGLLTFEINGAVNVVDDKAETTTGVGVGLRSLTVIPIHLDVGA